MTPHRREGLRREEDVERAIEQEIKPAWDRWFAWMFFKKTKLIAATVAIVGPTGAVLGFAVSTTAANVFAPKYAKIEIGMDSLRNGMDTLTERVIRVEATVAEGKQDRAAIRDDIRWVIYMQCDARKRENPNAFLPPVCKEARQ